MSRNLLLSTNRPKGRIVMLEMIATLSFVAPFIKYIFAEGEKAENLLSQAVLIRPLNGPLAQDRQDHFSTQ